MDLYAREGKRGGAWMDGYKSRRRFADGYAATADCLPRLQLHPAGRRQKARLSHDEIITLFP